MSIWVNLLGMLRLIRVDNSRRVHNVAFLAGRVISREFPVSFVIMPKTKSVKNARQLVREHLTTRNRDIVSTQPPSIDYRHLAAILLKQCGS